jgi:hypothetical protein
MPTVQSLKAQTRLRGSRLCTAGKIRGS